MNIPTDTPDPAALAEVISLLRCLSRAELHRLRFVLIPALLRDKTRLIEDGWPEPVNGLGSEPTS